MSRMRTKEPLQTIFYFGALEFEFATAKQYFKCFKEQTLLRDEENFLRYILPEIQIFSGRNKRMIGTFFMIDSNYEIFGIL